MERKKYTKDGVPCVIRGHQHMLTFVREDTQQGSGNKAWTMQCPTNARIRFFHIVGLHGVTMPIDRMPRMTMPRYGWKVTATKGYGQ